MIYANAHAIEGIIVEDEYLAMFSQYTLFLL